MGKYDDEREALGLKPLSYSNKGNSSFGKYDDERNRILGEVKTYEYDPIAEDQAKQSEIGNSAIQQMSQMPMLGLKSSPIIQQSDKFVESHPQLPGRNIPVIGPVLKGLDFIADNPISNAIAEYTMPNAPFIDQPGTNVRQTFLNESGRSPSTGVSKFIGAAAAPFFVPGAQLGTGNQVADAVGSSLERLPKLANFGNISKSSIQGAAVGGLTGAGSEFAQGNADVKNAAISGALGTALGGALGAGIPAAIEGISKGTSALRNGINSLSEGNMQNLSISPFKRIGQKTRVPDNPETVSDLIDVGGRQQGPDNGSLWSRIYTNIVDEQAPLNRSAKEISGGKKLSADEDPSNVAWLSRGWKGKADTKLQYGFMDNLGNKVGNSFEETLAPIKNRLNDLREYAVALRSLEYEKDGLQSGVSRDLAEKTIAKFSNDKDIQTAYEGVRQYLTDMNTDTLVNSGIWSLEKLMQMRRDQPNYIPMFRVQEKGIRDGMQQVSGRGFGNVKDPTKARTGSAKPIVDPIESIVKQTYKNQALAERNNVMRSLVELAEKNPDNTIMQKVENSKAIDEVQRSLDEFINNPSDDMEKQLTQALDIFKPQTVNGKRNVFTVMRNGKAEQWQINDDQLAKVIAGLGNEPSNPLINMVGQATGILKAGLVLAPDFVAKNIIRDQLSAFINSRYGFIPIWDTISGLLSAVKKDSSFWKWMNSGGANGAWVSLERDYLQGQIREITQQNIRKMGNPIELMRKLSEISEQATRIGEFKRGLKKGASLHEAALASRDVTLDFSRIGAKTKSVNKTIAFFNVAVQSIDKMARQFKDRPVAAPLKTAVSITVPSVLLYFINSKKPEYNELPQWERDTYWHVYVPGVKEPIRIPKPFELGITAGTFFERLLRSLKENDQKAFDEYGKQVLDGFTPSLIPTLLNPWIEAYANKDMFSKAPIVPKREENLLPKDQFGPYTSTIARNIGDKASVSPRILENYITGYTGTLGKYGLQAADNAYNMSTGNKNPAKPDQGLAGIPVLRSFVSRGLEGSSQSVDDFYKEKERLTRERASAKKNGNSFQEEEKYDRYNKISEQISNLQGQIRSIQSDMNMNSKEKRNNLERINLEIINLARQAKGLQIISK